MNTEAIKSLRERTHLSMSVCVKALQKSGGDIDKALIDLQTTGALKKPDTVLELKEGIVKAAIVGQEGRIIKCLCQTDFCSRSELFTKFVDEELNTGGTIFKRQILGIEKTVAILSPDKENLISAQCGEQIFIEKANKLVIDKAYDTDPSLTSSVIRCYNHFSGKISVMLGVAIEEEHKDNPKILEFLGDCAMQIAANAPIGVSRIDHRVVDKLNISQMPIFIEQAQSKPEKIREKIVQGKINAWMAEVALLEQPSLIHSGKTINSLMDDLRKELNSKFVIVDFIRYELGE